MKKYFEGLKFGMILQLIIGPVCLMIFNTSQNHGFLVAFSSVIAVAIVDATYIYLARIGATKILKKKKNQRIIKLIGSIILTIFGINTIISVFGYNIIPGININLNTSNAFLQGLLVNLSNPITIVFWTTVLTTKLVKEKYTKKELNIFSIGLVSATLLFLSFVALVGTIMSSFIPIEISNIINIIVGLIIIGFGLKMLIKK